MYKGLISIVVPVKELPKVVDDFILGNLDILSKCKVIVIDSGGGEALKGHSFIYLQRSCISMSIARRIGYRMVTTPYILNLDSDTILPENFIEYALILLDDKDIAMVAVDYKNLQGHYAFGASLWKSDILNRLYDYIGFKENKRCECLYMIDKLRTAKYKLETLPFRACHIGKE
jgi:hypothetical protein